ncbi:cortactin [Fusarium coicis]|nr:cortactin [Fusarium coicis]
MTSLNTSINGPSIKSSYSSVVNGAPPSSDSPTHAHWALFSVQAPLLNAFQDSGAKESILKVQGTGESDLADLIEDFSEGRIQFAFAKVKDPNSGLPKNILIAWCGGGVPERTKGYFTSHLAAVSKILHGYHVQITARSESDLEIESIMQKVADASGAKYSAGTSDSPRSAAPPTVKTKPVFTPTASSRTNPLVAARSKREENVDEDGWGADAPPVTRTQIEKVESAYKPTKVNIADLSKQPTATTSGSAPVKRDDTPGDVVKGGYQPIGKVDIAAIRAQAQKDQDDRPTPVKGSYEPVGKVDIAAIRAQAKPAASEKPQEDETRPVSERMSAFSQPAQSERLTSLPKPKVANKFGGAGGFSGTKAPTPGGLGFAAPAPAKSAPVGAASRTFADQGGKTPAQLWAERKARERGEDTSSTPAPAPVGNTSPVQLQKSGSEWKSGYSGKSWAPVQTGDYGRGVPGQISQENTGEQPEDTPASPSGVSALRDRFKDTAPISAGAPPPPAARPAEDDSTPPPVPSGRPSGGFALPGLPSRPAPTDEQDDEREDPSAYQTVTERERSPSPPRVAVPVSRGPVPEVGTPPEQRAPPPITPSQINVPKESDLADDKEVSSTARFAGGAAAGIAVGAVVGVGAAAAAGALEREPSPEPEPEPESHRAPEPAAQPAQEPQGGYRAVIQYDYEKAEDNEIDLIEGDVVTNIDMVDEDWWMGTNSRGESGLFPSNYVELVGDDDSEQPAAAAAPPPPPPVAEPEPEPEPETQAAAAAAPAEAGHTAVALYDYEAAEDNELSFPEDATITNLEFPDEDWWFGHYAGQAGLFPANYVQLNQ